MRRALLLALTVLCSVLLTALPFAFAKDEDDDEDEIEKGEVRLPWKEFKKLLEKKEKVEVEKPKPKPRPPENYIITNAAYEGDVATDSATISARLNVIVLIEEAWVTVPVLSGDVALKDAKVTHSKSDAIAVIAAGDVGYELVTNQPGNVSLELTFCVKVTESGGVEGFHFKTVRAAANTLKLTIPKKDLDIRLPDASSLGTREVDGKTEIDAALPAGAAVSVMWERELPEMVKPEPKVYAEIYTLASIGDGVINCENDVNFTVLHAGITEFKIWLPPDASVIDVIGGRIRDWKLTKAEDGNLIEAVLSYEMSGTFTVSLFLEKVMAEPSGAAEVPAIRVLGVERQKGYIGVEARTNVEIATAKTEGAGVVDVRELPSPIFAKTTQPILLGYKYVKTPYAIALDVRKHADVPVLVTVIDTAVYTTMRTADGKCITKVLYNVRNNRTQFLRIAMPMEMEIWSVFVAGVATKPARDEDGRLLIPLARSQGSASGMSSFGVEIVYMERREAQDPEERKPIKMQLPRVDVPITQLLWTLYLPKDYRYYDFAGTVRQVESFTPIATEVYQEGTWVTTAVESQVAALRAQLEERTQEEFKTKGVAPVKVQLPLDGQIFRFERLIVIDDALEIQYTFRGGRGGWLW